MDTGQHFGITKAVLESIDWIPNRFDLTRAIQAFNWFPDYLSILDLYKKLIYSLGWVDYFPIPIPFWGKPQFQLFKDIRDIKSLSKGSIAEKDFHQFHFDNLFSFEAIQKHWTWLKRVTKENLQGEPDLLIIFSTLGNSLHAVQDFYSHSNWVEYLGETYSITKIEEFPLFSDIFPSPKTKWLQIYEDLIEQKTSPLASISTGYFPPNKHAPQNAFYHDDRRNCKPGLHKDKASRPYFNVVYHLAIQESIKWLEMLRNEDIITNYHINLLEDDFPKDLIIKTAKYSERAQILSQRTRHWDSEEPFSDLEISIIDVKVKKNTIQGKIQLNTSEDLKKSKGSFKGAYTTFKLDENNDNIIKCANKKGKISFKIPIPENSFNSSKKTLKLNVKYGLFEKIIALPLDKL
ncbi:MAG: hypothetical protein ACXAC7_05015 [Candidatus Hodarchaeales archaeon]